MLLSLLPARAPDVLLDPGSSQLRIAVPGSREVVSIPAVIAVRTHRSGRQEVVAHGEAAAAMRGRSPAWLQVRRPIRGGRLLDPASLTALLQRALGALGLRPRFARLRASVLWPEPATEPRAQQGVSAAPGRALYTCLGEAGLRVVTQTDPAVAAAQACHTRTDTHLVLICGASTVHLRLVVGGALGARTTIELGGDVLDAAVLREVLHHHALHIAPSASERTRKRVAQICASSTAQGRGVTIPLRGRCARTGLPTERSVPVDALQQAMQPTLAAVGHALRRVMESLPAARVQHVADQGVLLAGGLALQPGLDTALRAESGLLILATASPDLAPIHGLMKGAEAPNFSAERARVPTLALP